MSWRRTPWGSTTSASGATSSTSRRPAGGGEGAREIFGTKLRAAGCAGALKNCARRPPRGFGRRPSGRGRRADSARAASTCARAKAAGSRRRRGRRSGGGGGLKRRRVRRGGRRQLTVDLARTAPGSAARMSARWATTTPLTERIRSPSRRAVLLRRKGDDGDCARRRGVELRHGAVVGEVEADAVPPPARTRWPRPSAGRPSAPASPATPASSRWKGP